MDSAVRMSRVDRPLCILDAGMRLFSSLPYADVHMDSVAAAAGVAKPTLYRYFATKETLFIEGLAWTLAELRLEIGKLRGTHGEAEPRLRGAVRVVLEGIGRLSPAIQAFEGASSELGERSRRVLRAGFAALQDEIGLILAEGARAGDFASVDTELAVLMIVGGIRMSANSARHQDVDPDALADLVLNGLRPGRRPAPSRPQPLGAAA